MTLITAIIGGLICGYFVAPRLKAFLILLLPWTLVLIFQTTVALDPEDVPPESWEYVPVQIVILLVGAAMVWIGGKIRSRFAGSQALDSN
jgi:hypothetical protein